MRACACICVCVLARVSRLILWIVFLYTSTYKHTHTYNRTRAHTHKAWVLLILCIACRTMSGFLHDLHHVFVRLILVRVHNEISGISLEFYDFRVAFFAKFS